MDEDAVDSRDGTGTDGDLDGAGVTPGDGEVDVVPGDGGTDTARGDEASPTDEAGSLGTAVPPEDARIAPLADLPEEGTLLFTARTADGETREAFALRTGDGVAGWENHCQHWTDVRLDGGDGATLRGGEVVCARHGATFARETGHCTFGPCEGAYLDEVAVSATDGWVVLDEPGWTVEGLGPGEERDPVDRSASGDRNVGF